MPHLDHLIKANRKGRNNAKASGIKARVTGGGGGANTGASANAGADGVTSTSARRIARATKRAIGKNRGMPPLPSLMSNPDPDTEPEELFDGEVLAAESAEPAELPIEDEDEGEEPEAEVVEQEEEREEEQEVVLVPKQEPVTPSFPAPFPDVKFRRASAPIPRLLSHSRSFPPAQENVEGSDNVPGTVTITLPLPIRLAYSFAKQQAGQHSTPLRDYLSMRVAQCADHNAEKPIYLNDRHRRAIEQAAHRNFDTAEELVGWVITILSGINVNDTTLSVEPELIARALYRKEPGQSDGECLSEYLTAGIEIKTGMR